MRADRRLEGFLGVALGDFRTGWVGQGDADGAALSGLVAQRLGHAGLASGRYSSA
jgi:hypothetical protein